MSIIYQHLYVLYGAVTTFQSLQESSRQDSPTCEQKKNKFVIPNRARVEILSTLGAQLFLCIIRQSGVIPTVFLIAGTLQCWTID